MLLRALSSYGARGKFEEYERKCLYVVMHLRLQITETSSFCSFNFIVGFGEMLC